MRRDRELRFSGKIYLNYLPLLIFAGVFGIGTILIFFLFQPIVGSPMWVVYGTYAFTILLLLYMSKFMPFVLISKDKELIFVGAIWKYKLCVDWVDEVVIHGGGFFFKPNIGYKNKFKSVVNYPTEPYIGFKTIAFYNYKALGVIIEMLKPKITGDLIDWDKLSKKRKIYLREKLNR